MTADAPPAAPIEQVVTQAETRDALAEYRQMIADLASAPTEGYVDPHVAEITAQMPDEVTGLSVIDDVDPGYLGGPSDAELAAGDDVDGLGSPSAGLPTEADLEAGDRVDDVETNGDDAPATPAAPAVDPVEALTKTLRAANPKLTLAQAALKAEEIIGEGATAPNEDGEPAAAAAPDADLPSADALMAERRELDKAWRKSVRDMDDDEKIDAMEQRIAEIDALIPQAKVADVQRVEAVTTAYEAAAQKAIAAYPDAAKEGTPLYNRMAEIHSDLEASGDALISDPNKALIIAQMAAKELLIAPRKATASAKVTPPGPRGSASVMSAMPAAGSQRRTTAPVIPAVAQQVEKIDSPDAYNNFIRSLSGR
jgi:hypothetical protein